MEIEHNFGYFSENSIIFTLCDACIISEGNVSMPHYGVDTRLEFLPAKHVGNSSDTNLISSLYISCH
jgi:hypothetical protein